MKKYLFLSFLAAASLLAYEEREPPSVTEVNRYLQEAIAEKNWWGAVDYADMISYNFPTTPFAQETPFQAGFAYYQLGQFELANDTLTGYLNDSTSHAHFEEAIQMKFEIAEAYRNGAKKPLFGSHKLPKWMPAKEDAVQIYEEVITTLPHSDLAAKSLLGKAIVQAEIEDYKPAVETLHLLIRRFPKHDVAAQGFLEINRIYLEQSKNTSLDLDVLDLAEVNLRKFRLAFPREPRLADAEKFYAKTQELFAENLFETGEFFERTKKVPASLIYYNKVIAKYPATKAAESARKKLEVLQQQNHF
jgi:outer membrane protein assembly factor BamD (BamD/ComL family)